MTLLDDMSVCRRMTIENTVVQVTLMRPSVTSTAINPMLDPTQSRAKCAPDCTGPRHRLRKWRLSGVRSYDPAALATAPATIVPCGR
jgi:hypothetical protein